jgi:hypothetical protein
LGSLGRATLVGCCARLGWPVACWGAVGRPGILGIWPWRVRLARAVRSPVRDAVRDGVRGSRASGGTSRGSW